MKYLGIYDLRILPLSLGDMLSWLATQKLLAKRYNSKKLDIFVIFPPSFVGNLLNEVKTREFWKSHLDELSLIFSTDADVENFYVCSNVLEINNFKSYFNGIEALGQNEFLLRNLKDINIIWSYIRSFQRFDLFNDYFISKKKTIILESHNDVRDEALKILDFYKISEPIVCQPRFRMIDNGLPPSDPRRDSSFLKWNNFLRIASTRFPNQKFLIIGRRQSIPDELLAYGNVTCSRDIGMSLGHELALVRQTKIFIGASSGFAIAANFSKSPYIIYNLKPAGIENYGLETGRLSLIFASYNQIMLSDEIDFEKFEEIVKIFQIDIENRNLDHVNREDKKFENTKRNIFQKKKIERNYIYNLISNDLEVAINKALNNDTAQLRYILEEIKLIWPEFSNDIFIRNLIDKKYSTLFLKLIQFNMKFSYILLRYTEYYNMTRKYMNYGILVELFKNKLRKILKLKDKKN